jgi:predicted outer membrane repeat protein
MQWLKQIQRCKKQKTGHVLHFKMWLPVVLFWLVLSSSAFGNRIIYVDDDAIGNNDGTRWENAYTFLQDALIDANDSEKPVEIRVAQGIYKPDQGRNQILGDQSASFHMINGVNLIGGYAGLIDSDPNKRDIELYTSTLSGDLADNDVNIDSFNDIYDESAFSDNSRRVIKSIDTDQTALLDGFTITGGRMKSAAIDQTVGGAGMINYSGNPIIKNCTFTQNIASQCGGGMLNMHESNPTLIDCTFICNYSFVGGGLYNSSSNLTLVRCKFISNYAEYGGAGTEINNATLWESPQKYCLKLTDCIYKNNYARQYGGGLLNRERETVLTNCTFLDNSAHHGGGIYNYSDNPTLINCQLIGNSASQGGGMYSNSGSPKLNNCTFIRNYAEETGGGVDSSDTARPMLVECILIDNYSNRNGGGLAGNNSIYNCIISGNTAAMDGGAIYGWGEVINCTVVSNSASRNGGGICTQGITTLMNSILFNNNASIGDEIYLGVRFPPMGRSGMIVQIPSVLAISYSNVRGGKEQILLDAECTLSWESGNIDADPCFADPGYWADADDSNVVDEPNDPNAVWIDGDYHLKSQAGRWDPNSQSWIVDDVTSPCIDAGDPNSPIGHEPFPNGGIINMGAYGGTSEASKSYFGKPVCETIIAGDINGDCKVDFDDLMILINHWLEDYTPQE